MPLFYDKRYGTYNYIWREGGRQRWKSLGKDRKVAQLKAQELDRRRALGELTPLLVRTKIEDHLRWFLQYHVAKRRPDTQRSYRFCLKQLLVFFDRKGVSHLDQVTRPLWEHLERDLLRRYAVDTRNDIFNVLSVFLNLAVENNLLIKNPLKGVKRRLKNPAKRRPKLFSEQELRKLRKAAPDHFRPIIDVMVLTGLRRGELATLEWEDIDLKRKTLTVQAKPDLSFTPKDYEIRTVGLSEQAIQVLRNLANRHRFVFDTGADRPMLLPDALSHNFLRVRRRAGLKEGTLHTLRRTYATRLKDMGINLHYIRDQLGHESLSTTERYLGIDGSYAGQKVSGLRFEAITPSKSQAKSSHQGQMSSIKRRQRSPQTPYHRKHLTEIRETARD